MTAARPAAAPAAGAASISPSITLRPAEVEDAGEILTMQWAAFVKEAREHDTPHIPPLAESLDELRAALVGPNTRTLVAELSSERGLRIVGSARCTVAQGRGWIGRVAVAPDLAGRGIGSALLQNLHDDPGGPVSGFSLWAGGKSLGNHAWYAGHGYLTTGRGVDPLGVPVVGMARPVLRAVPDPAATEVVCVLESPTGGIEVGRGPMLAGESLRTAAVRIARSGSASKATSGATNGVVFQGPRGYHREGAEGTPITATVVMAVRA